MICTQVKVLFKLRIKADDPNLAAINYCPIKTTSNRINSLSGWLFNNLAE